MKKLLKNNNTGKIAGVCAGLSEYLDIDVSFIRIIWAICAFTGVGLLAYLIAAVVIPVKDESK